MTTPNWEAFIETSKDVTKTVEEKTMSFVMRDASGTELASGYIGSDSNKKAAIAKGNDVLVDGSDSRLANPAAKYGTCLGMCCVMCGCCWCDCLCTKYSIAQSFCTGKLRLLGAVPVQLPDGSIGTYACAGAMDCENDKAVAVGTLKAHGYTANDKGVYVNSATTSAPEVVVAEK